MAPGGGMAPGAKAGSEKNSLHFSSPGYGSRSQNGLMKNSYTIYYLILSNIIICFHIFDKNRLNSELTCSKIMDKCNSG